MLEFLSPFTLFEIAVGFSVLLVIVSLCSFHLYAQAKEVAPLRDEKASLEARIKELLAEKNGLLDELAQAKAVIADGASAKKWLEENIAKIDDGQRQITQLNQEIEAAKSQQEILNQKVSDKQQELAELNHKLQVNDERFETFEQEYQVQIDVLEEQKNQLKKEISELKSQKNDLTLQINTLTAQVRSLQSQSVAMQQKLEGLEKDIKAKQENLEILARTKASQLAEFEHIQKKAKLLTDDVRHLETTKSELIQSQAAAENVIAHAKVYAKNEANMWKDLERPVASIIQKPTGAVDVKEEVQALVDFQKALKDSGYVFDIRTIKAFHTGLLCGDVSPLVILSGISGTGKSLLPKLYAKYFNMNFLPVAVQPRWDGPQDVFGFYNHMEERYKATELSRLLWQFDRYNNQDAQKHYLGQGKDEQLPMSLVLLDEMNLARVEYYFSELLSKLEFRNELETPEEKQNRFSAEIELEYGSSSFIDSRTIQELGRRLFIDYNILLVGTMNEDESTQTLSSKVIDRANILRFGSPKDLDFSKKTKGSKEGRNNFDEYCKNFVSYATWTQWRTPKNKLDVDFHGIMKQFNEILSKVNRGFGYRTDKAALRYIERYPGNKKDALVDQIEMKILPKLNGVAVDALSGSLRNEIEDILHNKLGDEEVTEAFNETLGNDAAFFVWQGVRRQ